MCDFPVATVGLDVSIYIYCHVGIRILRMQPVATPVVMRTMYCLETNVTKHHTVWDSLDTDMISCSMDSITDTGDLCLFIVIGQWPAAADKGLIWPNFSGSGRKGKKYMLMHVKGNRIRPPLPLPVGLAARPQPGCH